MTRAYSLTVMFCCWMQALPAFASDGGGTIALELSVDDCLASVESELRDLLAIELATLAATDEASRGDALVAWVGCAPGSIVMAVRRGAGGHAVEERLRLSSFADPGTVRTIALALTELVGVARGPSSLAPAPSEPAPSANVEEPWWAGLAAAARAPVGGGPFMAGLGLEVSRSVLPLLRLTGGAEWVTGVGSTSFGQVAATSLTAHGAASVGVEGQRGRLGADLGLRLGGILWSGRPSQEGVRGERALHPFAGLFGRFAGELAVRPRLRLRGALEIGGVVAGTRGLAVEGTSGAIVGVVSLDRWWLSAALGVLIAL